MSKLTAGSFVVFLAIVVVSQLFDRALSTRALPVKLTQIALKEDDERTRTPLADAAAGIHLAAGQRTEILAVEVERTVFPGPFFVEITIEDGYVDAYKFDWSETFSSNSKSCKHTQGSFRCRVYFSSLDARSPLLVVATRTPSAVVGPISATSIAQHQLVWGSGHSIVFLFALLLPLAVITGFSPAPALRKSLLLAGSLLFIYTMSPALLLAALFYLSALYGFLRFVAARHTLLTYTLGAALGVVFVKLVWPLFGVTFHLAAPSVVLPLGISYLIARQIDLALKLRARQISLPSASDFLLYSIFWPSLPAGPVTQFQDLSLDGRAFPAWRERAPGLLRFGQGLAKKALGDLLFQLMVARHYEAIVVHGADNPALLLTFFMGNMLFVYLDFSGYTDMALGSARLAGIRLPENFNYPLLRSNMRAFWQCWHMSLTAWVYRTVYIPLALLLRREPPGAAYLIPIFATTLTMGLWHGAHSVWILWAAHHGIGIILSDGALQLGNKLRPRLSKRQFKIVMSIAEYGGVLFVWHWLMLSYCFTLTTNTGIALDLYRKLFFAPFLAVVAF